MKVLYSLIFSSIVSFIGTMVFNVEYRQQQKEKYITPIKQYMNRFVRWFIPSFVIALILFFFLL